jgi:hypothetical protein
MLDAACNGIRYFIWTSFTLPHMQSRRITAHFYTARDLDPYIRRFVRYLYHSHHRYFVDPRHMDYTTHLWVDFVIMPFIILR